MQYHLVTYKLITNVLVGQNRVQDCPQGLVLRVQRHGLLQVKGSVAVRNPHPVLPPQRTQHRLERSLIEHNGYFAVKHRARPPLREGQLASQ